jgi:hypothetical protein
LDINIKLSVLDKLYRLYSEFINTQEVCCKRFCAFCCTRNVAITTLEGIYIVNQMNANEKEDFFGYLDLDQSKERFIPKMTINQMTDCCKNGGTPPEDEIDPNWTPCPLLKSKECPVYLFRPFGCRCLVSTVQCGETGFAQIDPFILTVNTIFQQYIEQIDSQGATGNLIDILRHLKSEELRQDYQRNEAVKGINLISNYELPCLMIPPEHREMVKPILRSIQHIRV